MRRNEFIYKNIFVFFLHPVVRLMKKKKKKKEEEKRRGG